MTTTRTTRPLVFALVLGLAQGCDPGGDGGSSDGTGTTGNGSTSSSPADDGGSTTAPATTAPATTAADTTATTDGGAESSSSDDGETTSTTDAGGSTDDDGSSSSGGMTSEACFDGGMAAPQVPGSGTCDDPYVVDLSMQAHGTIYSHDLSGGSDLMDLGGPCDATPESTARDVVYLVMMPTDVMELQISVDPTAGADPRIAVAEDPSCFQPMNACADELSTGACEGLVAPRSGKGFYGTSTYVVISETIDSGADLVVRFQTAP